LLEHPNIVSAYDADEVDGVEFLVMQYVNGTSLSSLVKDRGPLPVPMAISCILQAARGLEYAHLRGVVHRDVKPSNLLLDRDGTLKILDMGLARLDSRSPVKSEPDLTDTGEVMGTADYMAPEQAVNMKLSDGRADIYSLGYTLWYLLTGREAYSCENRIEKIVAHFERSIPSLQEARSEISPALESVFKKMVAKKPEDRHQTMTEVITDLERCRTSEAAAETHTPPSVDDRELTNFLQALPELATDREPRHIRRTSISGGSTSDRKNGRTRRESARIGNGGFARQWTEGDENAVPIGNARRSGGPRRVSRVVLSLLAVAAVVTLIVTVGLMQSQGSKPSNNGPPAVPPPPGPASSPPPTVAGDWVALIGKQGLEGWRQVGTGTWKNESGVLVGQGEGGWLATERTDYRDFELSVDYRISREGQSGIFLRAAHMKEVSEFLEVQIQDDSAPKYQKSDSDERTGALTDISPPSFRVNASANQWHTVVIRIEQRAIKVWFDEKRAINTDLKDYGLTRPRIHTDLCGCIGLEAGGGTVEFRNLRLHELTAKTP